jgi:chemotaxis protein histidine kinase CheA
MHALDWRASGLLFIDPEGRILPFPVTGTLPKADAPGLAEALGLGQEQEALFRKWLRLAALRHRDMRWEKLAALAPLHEMPRRKEGEGAFRLAYRKLLDGEGGLYAVAVAAVDGGQSQAMASQLEEERQRHSLEIRDFLALSANPPETVRSFLEDAVDRLDAGRRLWDGFLAAGNFKVTELWGVEGAEAAAEGLGHRIFRDLHMLKGNAGAFGFDGLAAAAQEAEELLEGLKRPKGPGPEAPLRMASALSALETQVMEMSRALRLISGEGQDAMARILKWKLDRLQNAAGSFDLHKLEPRTRSLVELSRRLPFLSPAYLARKYRHLVERLAGAQGKEVRFRVIANTGDIHPESFSRVDEALVHILRNMVDHGVESPSEREAAGKEEAIIELEYLDSGDKVSMRVRDDGRGMDSAAFAARAAALGLMSRAEADALPEPERLALIFREGFTTRPRAGMVSGRGLGLALAARCVADQGGTLSVTSETGRGSVFSIGLPPIA